MSLDSGLFSGRYWFHLHTSWSGAKADVDAYFRKAKEQGVEQLAFLEHIQRDPTYDVGAFGNEVRAASDKYGIPAAVGFEAGILPDGALDIREEHVKLADVIGVAEREGPEDAVRLRHAFYKAMDDAGWWVGPRKVVWIHPGLILQQLGRLEERRDIYSDMITKARAHGILIERNLRHDLLPESWFDRVPEADRVIGVDAYDVTETGLWWSDRA